LVEILPDNAAQTRVYTYAPDTPYYELRDWNRDSLDVVYAANEIACLENSVNQSESNVINALFGQTGLLNQEITNAETTITNNINGSIGAVFSGIANNLANVELNLSGDIDVIRSDLIDSEHRLTTDVLNAMTNSTNLLDNAIEMQRLSLDGDLLDLELGVTRTIETTSSGILGSIADLGGDVVDLIGGVGDSIGLDIEELVTAFETAFGTSLDQLLEPIAEIARGVGEIAGNGLPGLLTFLSEGTLGFGKFGQFVWEEFSNSIGGLRTIYEKLVGGDYHSWEELKDDLESIGSEVNILQATFALFFLLPTILQAGKLVTYPALAQLQNIANEKARANILDPGVILTAYQKGKITLNTVTDELGLDGFADERIRVMLLALEEQLNPDEIRMLYLKGEISGEFKNALLTRHGYNSADIERLTNLYWMIPPVQDLITMAVREVFTPAVASQYGLYEDYPEDFDRWAKKQGLTTEWSKNYWAAHWQLPSALQGFQMFHRGIIDDSDMELLLKSLDYMPFWRERMIQLSFNPLTRVDVRRMHDLGILSLDDVEKSYLALGYSPENAKHMTEFTRRYNAGAEETDSKDIRELSKSVIEKAYLQGLFDKDEAKVRLGRLDYSSEDSDIILDMLDLNQQLDYTPDYTSSIMNKYTSLAIKAYTKRAMSHDDAIIALQDSGHGAVEAEALLHIADLEYDLAFKADVIQEVKSLYVERTIDEVTLRSMLENIGFKPTEIELILEELNVYRMIRGKKPSRTDLKNFRKSDTIDTDEYIEEQRGLGYPDKYIDMYLRHEGWD